MRTRVSLLLLLFLCGAVFAGAPAAQSPFAESATSPKDVPFAAGETLVYEGRLSKSLLGGLKFRSVSVANLVFTIANSPDSRYYVINGEANSKGSLAKLFRFQFRQVYESTIEREKFRALRTVKHDEQRDRVRDSEAVFDYQSRQVTYVETDPKDMMRPPRRIASAISSEETHDILSGIYTLRLLPLAVGKSFNVSVSDTGFVYSIPVRVTKRELQSTVLGKVWCFRVEPEIFGTRRLIEDKGKMSVWITDDKSRVPVRAEVETGIGRVDIKLKKISK